MFCSNCGAKIQADAKFCPNCGTPVPGTSVSSNNTQSSTNLIPMNGLQRLRQVLAQLELNLYYENLCDDLLNSGMGMSLDKSMRRMSELRKIGITRGIAGDGYKKGKLQLRRHSQELIIENRDVLQLVPERYLTTQYVDYIQTLIRERRVGSMAELYDKLDEQIHRWTMEQSLDEQKAMLADVQGQLNYLEICGLLDALR